MTARGHPAPGRPPGLPRGAGRVRREHRGPLPPDHRPHRRFVANRRWCSPACSTSRLRQGLVVRPLLRRLQHPAVTPSLPASCRASPKSNRDHPARRELLYAYSAAPPEDHRGAPEGLRRCLLTLSKDLGADKVLAWPTAEIAVMGAEGARDRLPPRDRGRRGPGGAPRGARRGVPARRSPRLTSQRHAAGGRIIDRRAPASTCHRRGSCRSPTHDPAGQNTGWARREQEKKKTAGPGRPTTPELAETVRVLAERVSMLEASLEEQEAAGMPERS